MNFPDDFINKVICGDCLEIMKQMPDKCVDLVLTDPPYEISLEPRNKKWKGNKNNFSKIDNDIEGFCQKWFPEVERISNNFIIFGANNFIMYIQNRYGWLVWNKRLSEKADRILGSPFELAIISQVNKYRIYRVQHGGVINADSVKGNNEKRFHPTQKPVKLMEKILNDFSKETDTILDPFLGSGTTAVAAKNLGRKFIGIEISPEYCKIAEDRLRQEVLLGGNR